MMMKDYQYDAANNVELFLHVTLPDTKRSNNNNKNTKNVYRSKFQIDVN